MRSFVIFLLILSTYSQVFNMKFKYKINLEIDVDFDAPLLGTDTTKGKRSRTDMIAKAALAEMIKFKTTSYVGLDRVIDEDNLMSCKTTS